MDLLQTFKNKRGIKDITKGQRVVNILSDTTEQTEPSERVVTDETSEDVSSKALAVAPAVQESDHQEKELDDLISKLNDARRHKIENARKKPVPMKALLHSSTLWLSDDLDDWTAANDTIYSFTSPFGLKQLQHGSHTHHTK